MFGNSVSYAEFGDQRAPSLRFVSEIGILHYEVNQPTALLVPSAEQYPFSYMADEVPDIGPLMVLNRPDVEGRLSCWAKDIADRSGGRTLAILSDMMETIRREFQYLRRPKPGTQDPVQTLQLRTGSCRDFALLMIEALRSLGFAARFVSGYIYSPSRANHQGGGATHAWVQVYLPGCGWLEIDPTNGILWKSRLDPDRCGARPQAGSAPYWELHRTARRIPRYVDISVSRRTRVRGTRHREARVIVREDRPDAKPNGTTQEPTPTGRQARSDSTSRG